MENSSTGVLDFGVLEDASSSQTMEGKGFWDRVDVMKAEIGSAMSDTRVSLGDI